MNERDLRGLLDQVKAGGLSRRVFVRRMMAVGLTAPMATQLLAFSGVAMAQSRPTYKPTKRGGGGLLKVLWWQGPTLLNPHFAVGTKDQDGSRLFYEPLAGWDADGNLRPILAESIPGREDGTLAADGKSVIWKLKKGVTWHDGKPFTADDCVFTWEYARDPATASLTSGSYKDVVVEKIDPYTVAVKFAAPTPFWADTFVAAAGCIIPKHLFADYMGAKSREAPANLKPVGTGPYKFKDFKPGDLVTGTINMNYHRVYSRAVDKTTGLRFDQSIALDGFYTRQEYPQHLRRVGFVDPETNKRLIFLTNHFALPALTIAALYKQRWQVELFFKWIKQNLRIRHFYGTSENAVKTQIWTAVCVYALAAIVKKELALDIAHYTFLQILSVHSFEKIPILQAFSQGDPNSAPTTFTKQLNLFNT